MNLADVRHQYVEPYRRGDLIYRPGQGFLVWRLGTGQNVELLHIKTFVKGKGYGRKLVYDLLDVLRDEPPYHSIFGFTRVSNEEARLFYGAMGFFFQEISGVYADGRAILFWQSYDELCLRRRNFEDHLSGKT